MANKRVTISIPEEILAKAQRAVDTGQVPTVSAYVTENLEGVPDWAAVGQLLEELEPELGEVDPEDWEWARQVLGISESGDFRDSDARPHAAA